jgi:hypothetical protein
MPPGNASEPRRSRFRGAGTSSKPPVAWLGPRVAPVADSNGSNGSCLAAGRTR